MHNNPLEMDMNERQRLLDWWNTMDAAKPMIRGLMSFITELRLIQKYCLNRLPIKLMVRMPLNLFEKIYET